MQLTHDEKRCLILQKAYCNTDMENNMRDINKETNV